MRQGLQTGCLILGILCLFYYIGIVIYSGITSDFSWIWVIGGALFLLLWRCLAFGAGHPDSPVRYVSRGLLVLLCAGILVILTVGGRIVLCMAQRPEADLDYVIVLGAQVRGTKPSRALRKRLDRALQYAQENERTVFILSGGQGPDEGISETRCMYQYLTEHGLYAERMILEDRSTSTRENLRYSAAFLDKEKDRIGILSNNFHICRALAIARKEGYRYTDGIPAHSDFWMQPHYILREVFALLAEKLRGSV